tara:strand:+ start:843 stop:1010 length:168 start_codon:yes stop_codon:yes gene_type:complete
MDLQSNTIDSIQITRAEYVIIKDLKKEYQLIKNKLIEEIFQEISNEEKNNKILKK